MFQQREISVI